MVLRGFCMGKTIGIKRELKVQLEKNEKQLQQLEKEAVHDHSKKRSPIAE